MSDFFFSFIEQNENGASDNAAKILDLHTGFEVYVMMREDREKR